MGYMTTEAFRFDKATHPQERMCWNMAAHAQAVLRDTDVENALAELSEPPHAGLHSFTLHGLC